MATPERISLSLPIAGIGSRVGAYLLDAGLLALFWAAAYFVLSFFLDVIDAYQALPGLGQTLLFVGVFATQWIYWTACEVLFEGRTLGKRLAGIRVVKVDGTPVGFWESAIRNLLRAVDFLPALYAVGVITMLVTRQHRRLGDLAAGTLLIRDERITLSGYARETRLSAADTQLLIAFLDRAPSLDPEARLRIARGLVERFGGEPTDDWPTAETFLRQKAGRA